MSRGERLFDRACRAFTWLVVAGAGGGIVFILATEHGKHFH